MKEIPIITRFKMNRQPEGVLKLSDEAYERIRNCIKEGERTIASRGFTLRFAGMRKKEGTEPMELVACSIEEPQ